jgi:hypothetical protein
MADLRAWAAAAARSIDFPGRITPSVLKRSTSGWAQRACGHLTLAGAQRAPRPWCAAADPQTRSRLAAGGVGPDGVGGGARDWRSLATGGDGPEPDASQPYGLLYCTGHQVGTPRVRG